MNSSKLYKLWISSWSINLAAYSSSKDCKFLKFKSPKITLISWDYQLYCSIFVPLSLMYAFFITCSNYCLLTMSRPYPAPLSKWQHANVIVLSLYFNRTEQTPLLAIFNCPKFIYEAAISLIYGRKHLFTKIIKNIPTNYSDLIFTYLSFSWKNSV